MEQKYPKAILLDFYGTLVEEDDIPIQKVCKEIADSSRVGATEREIGAFWSDVFSGMCMQSHGESFRLQKNLERLSLKRVLKEYEVDLDPNEISQYLFDYWMKPRVFPEAIDVVSNVRIPICLLSNIDNKELKSALDHTGFQFEHIVTSEDCRSYKPRVEMFDTALLKLGLGKEDVLHVGDSISSDVIGAKRNGIKVLWINRKKRNVDDSIKPDYISDNLTGMLDVLV